MLARIRYAVSACYAHRVQLRAFLSDSALQQTHVTNLTPADMEIRGVKALVLDFDGVLAAHGELHPRADVQLWLDSFVKQWAPNIIYILSNKPTLERQAYFAQSFPSIVFIVAKRKKPFPDGLQAILQHSGLAAAQILVVDDRLATGVIAAIASDMQGCWITDPYINLKQRPVCEWFFVALRWLERNLIKCVGV